MSVFLIFFYNILFSLIFGLLYFLLKEYKRVSPNFLHKNKILELTFILLFGAIFFLYEFFIATYSSAPLYFLTITPFVIFSILIYSQKKIIYYLSPFLFLGIFFNLYNNEFSISNIFLIILTIFIIIFLVQLLIRSRKSDFFEKKWKKLLVANYLYFFLFVILIIIYNSVRNFELDGAFFLDIFWNFLFFSFFLTLFLFLIETIEHFYINYFNLEKSINKEIQSFYKLSLWKRELKNLISEDQINFGAIILIDLKQSNKLSTHEVENLFFNLGNNVLSSYPNAFLFRATANYYSIFLPLEQRNINLKVLYKNNFLHKRNKDFLEKIDQILKNTSNDLRAAISLYGIDSYDIDELIKNAQYLFFTEKNEESNERILSYDYRDIKDSFLEKNEASNYINLYKEYKINYVLRLGAGRNYYCEYKVKINEEGKWLNYFQEKKNLRAKEQEFLDRFLSLKAIKEFDKRRFDHLIIEYPIYRLLSKDIDLYKFVNKIEQNFSGKINQLVLSLDLEDLSPKEINLLANQLLILNKLDLGYELRGDNFNNQRLIKKVSPVFK